MRFIDAHIHLADPEYQSKIGQILADAQENSVVGLVANAMDLKSSRATLSLSEAHPSVVFPAIGIHPWEAGAVSEDDIREVVELILSRKGPAVSVGEIGLDGRYSTEAKNLDRQRTVFQTMLRAAEEAQLPVSVHSRAAFQEVLEILSSFELANVLLHWYSGPLELIPEIISRGYYVSVGPSSVYVAKIQEIAKRIPLTQILVETDGPVRYQGIFKGKVTAPSFLREVVRNLAKVKGGQIEEVSETIYENTRRFLGLV